MKKALFLFALTVLSLALGACRNIYESDTYSTSDSYGDVFEGKKIPWDTRI